MRILVTNDDGIFSPGLLALAEVASRSAKCAWWRRTWNNPPWGILSPSSAPYTIT